LLFNSWAAFRIHGYTDEDLKGKNTIELIHPEDRENVLANLKELNSSPGSYVNVQYRYLNKDGSYTWMEATALNELENPLINGIISISRDIAHRKRMEEELKLALAVRDEFISIASHEFKTPITSLKLQLQMLSRQIKASESHPLDLEKLFKALSVSTKQVDRINVLVENLLDVARINAGSLNLKLEEFNLSDALKDNLELFRGLLMEAGCSVSLQIQKDIVGRWDRNRIEQVFVNLISNAIKYAPGKLIEISLSEINDTVTFFVKDHGPGIPQDKMNNIFEKFERLTAAKNISGLGLGLFITKQIVEAHHGTIRVESESGKGATLTVELPLTTL
jgi:PAS domain S-box-containing protein